MRNLIIACCFLGLLSACGSLNKDKLGLGKNVPDETKVTTRKPLSIPPEYDLRPVAEPLDTQEIESLEDVWAKN
ncbi:MAG: DUF3035 domain-containing protein [Alphaproteobacteria bacterium]|nr:DUF3035 domain-containing protein [Alphaproteobacteria bacterium]